MAFLFILLLVATASGTSSDLAQNEDEYYDDLGEKVSELPAQSSGFPGDHPDEENEEYPDEPGNETFVGEVGERPPEMNGGRNDGFPDEATPSAASEATGATKEVPSCESLAREGKCKMELPYRNENASCPAA
uniref:Secreted protein n=1 Tax=Haemonchus contortus TaxID=6289 RepID=A0A7I4YG07_HAECO|nr:unnamed protein product [Haemonchus contortus]